MVSSRHLSCLVRHQLTNEQKWCKSLVLTKLSLSITLIFHWLIIIWHEVIELSAFELFLFLMHRDELVGIQTIWWVDYQLAVGFLTGSWKSNLDVWISNHLFGNPTACLSWPRCSGVWTQTNQISNSLLITGKSKSVLRGGEIGSRHRCLQISATGARPHKIRLHI